MQKLTKRSIRFGSDLEIADLLTKAFLTFIKTTILLSLFFKTSVVQNY